LDRLREGLPIIPRAPESPMEIQFAPPSPMSALIIESYVRHVAHGFLESHPRAHIKGIKVYRVVHMFLPASRFPTGIDPNDPTTYLPYFWGEFEADGNLKKNQDGFLYWLLPILKVKPGTSPHFSQNKNPTSLDQDQFSEEVWLATRINEKEDNVILNY